MPQMPAEAFQPVGPRCPTSRSKRSPRLSGRSFLRLRTHTMDRYRSAFYAPLVSDWRNAGQWAEDGGKTATERASGIWQSELQRYVAPARDPAIVEALDSYVARRTAEGAVRCR